VFIPNKFGKPYLDVNPGIDLLFVVGDACPKIACHANVNCAAIAVCDDVDGRVFFNIAHKPVSEAGTQLSLDDG
jgi:hypothetical protein